MALKSVQSNTTNLCFACERKFNGIVTFLHGKSKYHALILMHLLTQIEICLVQNTNLEKN